MSDVQNAIERLQEEWSNTRAKDDNLDEAWRNCVQLLTEGTTESLHASAELIVRMNWFTGLTTWISFNSDGGWNLNTAILPEEQCFYGYVLLYCRYKALELNEFNWIQMWDEHLDWSNISIKAGSVPMLNEVPEWLVENLVMGLMKEIDVTPTDGLSIKNIEISHSFSVLRYPLTQFVVEALLNKNSSHNIGFLHPLDNISWFDAIHLCNQMSELFGLPPAYLIDDSTITLIEGSVGFRLPTEKEWEFAARAMEHPSWKYAGSAELWKVGIYDSNSSDLVGSNQPNRLGIYDFSGGIWEWCWDHDDMYASRKGGSWMSKEEACTVQFKSQRLKTFSSSSQGLRLFRNISPNITSTPSEVVEDVSDDWEW